MKKIDTKHAPKAIGPYSQAIFAGPFLFISGQLPIHPESGKIEEHTIQGQTKRVLDNLAAILKEAGCTFADVVKSEVFLSDLIHFQEMNKLYAERFNGEIKPARQAFQVARLPMDALIEISCIAYKK